MAAVAAMLEEHVVISCPRAHGRVDAWSGPRLIPTFACRYTRAWLWTQTRKTMEPWPNGASYCWSSP